MAPATATVISSGAAYPATAGEHASLLHPAKASGCVVIARATPRWSEKSWQSYELPDALYRASGEPDMYITQNSFVGHRRAVSELHRLSALFVDLDFYVTDLRSLEPETVLDRALVALELAGVPGPSLAFSSGQGLQLVWFHEPLQSVYLPKWNHKQVRLGELLKNFGADANSRDAARVLRIVSTINSKNGRPVRSLQDATDARYRFADLAAAIPEHNEESDGGADVRSLAVRRATKAGTLSGRRDWTEATLHEGRLRDLQTLRKLRFGPGQIMDDWRERWMLIAGASVAHLVEPEVLDRELVALAEEVGGWSARHTRQRMKSVFDRARSAACGEVVQFAGREWDPRYAYRNQTIIDLLNITPEEEFKMKVVISDGEKRRRKRERDRERQRRKRRSTGVKPRKESHARRVKEAHNLRDVGLSNLEVAEAMNVSIRTVQRWFR